MSKLIKYAQECKEISAAHGFWEDGPSRNRAEMVMLMVSELSECLEAFRKGHTWRSINASGRIGHYMNQKAGDDWIKSFKENCKDTVEDELADVVIRVLDYIKGWNVPYCKRIYRKESTGNFGNDLLRITHYLIQAYHSDLEGSNPLPGKDWGYVLSAIEAFCDWQGIDIEQHVRWKMDYNKSRPYKHDKKF